MINGGKHIDLAVEASVAALLNEDKWDEAIIACNARPELQFQKAYALYKKERFAEALAIVAAAEDGATAARWQHLHGQILFRLGRHREAAEQYDAIAAALVALGSDADPIDLADARTNLVATLVASDAPVQAVSHAALAPVIEALRRGKVRRLRVATGAGSSSSSAPLHPRRSHPVCSPPRRMSPRSSTSTSRARLQRRASLAMA